jgi:GrpB-like predicted nucleotidyltransferase (UPF0157 family)
MASSDPISILDYRPGWADEFVQIQRSLRTVLGDLALRIDHMGRRRCRASQRKI